METVLSGRFIRMVGMSVIILIIAFCFTATPVYAASAADILFEDASAAEAEHRYTDAARLYTEAFKAYRESGEAERAGDCRRSIARVGRTIIQYPFNRREADAGACPFFS